MWRKDSNFEFQSKEQRVIATHLRECIVCFLTFYSETYLQVLFEFLYLLSDSGFLQIQIKSVSRLQSRNQAYW